VYNLTILGCGWCGVLVAEKYGGEGVICIEKDRELGGLLKSVNVGGFTVDIGGSHVIFSKDEGILRKLLSLLGDNVVKHERRAYVLLDGLYVPYPLESGLYVLPPEERLEAVVAFVEALLSTGRDWRPRNLEEWIRGFFGSWIAKKYLIPYNRKVWKRPLTEIDVDWVYVPGRVPIPDWRDVIKSAMGFPTVGYAEQARFYYPLRGGIQALYDSAYKRALAKGVALVRGVKVESLKILGDHYIINGRFATKRLVSTIPLPSLIEALEGEARDDLKEYAKHFDYNKVITVAVALNKQAPPHHWVYVPDESIIFHRYAWLSNYSPYNAPEGKSLVLAEVTIPRGQNVSKSSVERKVISDLEKLGIINNEEDILFVKSWVNEYGYPIHRVGLSEIRDYVLGYLRARGILCLGRWGSWRYLNMDSVAKQVEQMSL